MNGSKLIAHEKDGKELLKILESSAAKGAIELIYTRRPDAYESYMKENGNAFVFISRNEEKAVGTCAELVRDVYINGERCKAAYICGSVARCISVAVQGRIPEQLPFSLLLS